MRVCKAVSSPMATSAQMPSTHFDTCPLPFYSGIAVSDFPRAAALSHASALPPSCGNGCCLLRSLSISSSNISGML